ncbi:MAG: transporter [Gemmatimonadetes bacterium]|nr:transporter [Gemmatimonadota bacterium]
MTSSVNPMAAAGLAPDDATRDLGFGQVVAQESRRRLVNRDGTFNVVRHGLSALTSLSAYHWLVTMTWTRFVALLAASMLVWNGLFAALFIACGPGALVVPDGAGVDHRWLAAYFFSVQTFATIGYGQIAPAGVAPNVVVVVESFMSVVFITLVTGIVFARFSRPTARVKFSERAVVAPYHGGRAFMFRLVNVRRSQLFELQAKVSCAYWAEEGGRRSRRFASLELERPTVNFLPLSWTVVHPFDASSPFHGLSETEFRALEPEFLVLLSGVDETWEQVVHARSSYALSEVTWGARFADIYDRRDPGQLAIDVRQLSSLERVAL